MADEGIKHTTLKINGINMHFADIGEGPIVLFLHGFPELWYSWRHQIHALAALGYRAVAPDMRGYGDTDAPSDASKYTYFHIVGDLVALIDALGADKVFVVGLDWGASVAWHLCLFRPDRVRALVNLCIPFLRRNPNILPVDSRKAFYGDDFYMCRFQVPGEMEAKIAEAGGAETLLAKIFPSWRPDPLLLPKGQWFKDIPPRPTWISEEDFAYYELGAASAMDRRTGYGANKVCNWRFGHGLSFPREPSLRPRGDAEGCAVVEGSGSDGRSWTFPAAGEAGGDQQAHL